MSHKIDRLKLIRERHRKLILEPRQREQFDVFTDWEDDDEFDNIDTFDEDFLVPGLSGDEDEE